jgi:hypothetical protein
MTAYFTLLLEYPPDSEEYPYVLLKTSDVSECINHAPGIQEKLEIKLEQDLISLDYISLGIAEGIHKINVEFNISETIKYAYTIFENLTSKGWNYVADGEIVGDSEEIIFTGEYN